MQTEEDIPDDDIIPQAFAVDDTDDNFDLNIPPTTGNEYLRRVRQEARECSRVVVAPIDAKAFNSKQTVKYKEPSSCLPPPRGLAPSPAWEKMQVTDFAELRQKLLRFRAMLNSGELNLKRPTLPSTNDADNWCRLCFDRLKIKTVAGDCFEESVEPMVEGGAMPLGAYNITDQPSTSQASMQGTPPLLSIVLFMDQTMVIKVLEYHVNWLEATGFTSHQGRWFYALLASLQKPLLPEACSLIRDLARLCSNLRTSLDNPEDSRLLELNLMICLVAKYFEQNDLA
ncbi:gem-associated protein 2-like [Haliotis rufescens]|uniref:gem-associated protein 2-like n=1 Tax=Haliotis rufescens TaxID=6454 RepID=UPI001EB01805|nr:gem-associated protein 2-like [Haliotis rufescens]